jgi:Xaa-Pro aminopeptidase
MIEGLLDLSLLDGDLQEVLETETYRNFCPHGSSHWLGLDVHDVGDQRVDGEWRPLEPGMVLTIEPGIYIPDSELMAHVPARFRGIGVRVEDDVLITADGPEVLTALAPKTISDIEATMAERP